MSEQWFVLAPTERGMLDTWGTYKGKAEALDGAKDAARFHGRVVVIRGEYYEYEPPCSHGRFVQRDLPSGLVVGAKF